MRSDPLSRLVFVDDDLVGNFLEKPFLVKSFCYAQQPVWERAETCILCDGFGCIVVSPSVVLDSAAEIVTPWLVVNLPDKFVTLVWSEERLSIDNTWNVYLIRLG